MIPVSLDVFSLNFVLPVLRELPVNLKDAEKLFFPKLTCKFCVMYLHSYNVLFIETRRNCVDLFSVLASEVRSMTSSHPYGFS